MKKNMQHKHTHTQVIHILCNKEKHNVVLGYFYPFGSIFYQRLWSEQHDHFSTFITSSVISIYTYQTIVHICECGSRGRLSRKRRRPFSFWTIPHVQLFHAVDVLRHVSSPEAALCSILNLCCKMDKDFGENTHHLDALGDVSWQDKNGGCRPDKRLPQQHPSLHKLLPSALTFTSSSHLLAPSD